MKLREGKACIDHIHVCVAIPPKYSVSTTIGYLRGKSAIIVFEKYSKLKKPLWGIVFGHEVTMSVVSAWMRGR